MRLSLIMSANLQIVGLVKCAKTNQASLANNAVGRTIPLEVSH
jgi:hypothetical protein